MQYKISKDRKSLIFTVNRKDSRILKLLSIAKDFDSDKVMHDFFDSRLALDWIDPVETGDLTSAPMVGTRGDDGNVAERWAFMDYCLRSPLADLRDTGKCVFVSD